MKKILFFLIFNFLIFHSVLSNNLDYKFKYGRESELSIIIKVEKVIFVTGDDIIINLGVENLSERELVVSPFLPIDDRIEYPDVKIQFYGNLADQIFNDVSSKVPAPMVIGGQCYDLKPGETFYNDINLSTYYTIEEISQPGEIDVVLQYGLSEVEWKSPGVGDVKNVGYKDSNSIRIFLNMNSELVLSNIRVEPHHWNSNWLDMEGKGVFTVWIESVVGYAVDDIVTDTILLNGTLEPTDIKLVPKSGNPKKKVIQLKFLKKDGILYMGELEKGEEKKINVSGQLKDGNWFYGETTIEIVN